MALTPAQLATLKAAIIADPTLNSQPMTADGAFAIAQAFNANATPDYWVYRKNIPQMEIGKTVSYVAIAAMTTANLDRVNNFLNLNPDSFNGRDDVKTFLNDTFGGTLGGEGANTRAALDLMLRRLATRAEKLFATGTGLSTAPAAMSFEGALPYQDVEAARALP